MRLSLIEPEDLPDLYRLAVEPSQNFRWRFGGQIPSPAAFEVALWDGICAQFVVRGRRSGSPLGLVTGYGLSPANQYAYVGVLARPRAVGSGHCIEGAALMIEYLFENFNLHKLYVEVPDYNTDQLKSALQRFFVVEGCLGGHHWHADQRWDRLIFSMYRDSPQRVDLQDFLARLGFEG